MVAFTYGKTPYLRAIYKLLRKIKMEEELLFRIALSLVPNIGDVRAKLLVNTCGSAEAVFRERRSMLERIPGIGQIALKGINKKKVLPRAETEFAFIKKNKIKALFFLDDAYPKRLLHCEDGPLILYYKGNSDLNQQRIISIVGTRDATDHGRATCEKLVHELQAYDPLIVSGLAYGIDICAHRSALECGLETIGVVAHGLDKLYPSVHREVAKKMLKQGGLLSDFLSQTSLDPRNFPGRNRIVAGMADATVVIESKKNGGSLITADIANSYNRDVFAFPGRITDECSEGCNKLIQQNKAALITSAQDLVVSLGWEEQTGKKNIQKKLFVDLSKEEEKILQLLSGKGIQHMDDIALLAELPLSKVSGLLLNLEFSGLVRSLPGKQYTLN